MAERRMFTEKIVESDAFLDMPLSTQALYFHLCMNADDDGFVKNPRKIQKMLGASDDDCKLLVNKRFILPFESGVIVVKHWRMHNLLRKDRYKPTEYIEEKSMLYLKENGAYTLDKTQGILLMATNWQPTGNQLTPQERIGENRIGENRREIIGKLLSQKFPKLSLDVDVIAFDIDQDKLFQEIERSQFLKASSLSFIIDNYDKVISGKYATFKPQKDCGFEQRNYSKEQSNEVYDSLDDVELN